MKRLPNNLVLVTLLALISVIFIAACQSDETPPPEAPTEPPASSAQSSPIESPLPTPAPPEPTRVIVDPEPGAAAFQGAIFAASSNGPIGGTQFYLTRAVGLEENFVPPVLGGPRDVDIEGMTELDGSFALTNVPPGKYYMVIWAPLNWILLNDMAGIGDELPILLELEADKTEDIGVMTINWP